MDATRVKATIEAARPDPPRGPVVALAPERQARYNRTGTRRNV